MVLCGVTLSLKPPPLCTRSSSNRGPTLHFGLQAPSLETPVQMKGPLACSFRHNHRLEFEDLGRLQMQCGSLRFTNLRISASSGDGSGSGSGSGGGDGGYGGENYGGGEGDGGKGGKDWSFLSWYLALLAKYPVLVKSVTSGILNGLGDLICQLVFEKSPSADLKRTFRFSLLGLALVGPALHYWYLYLSKLVTMPGASGAFLRLLLDQFIFTPVFLGAFLTGLVTLEGRPSHVIPKLQQEWFSSVVANWKLWIPFQFFNFRFVPQQFQVLAANVLALAWNVILSFKAHREIITR
ncbi:protein sym-1 [Momordica charantia]|uniref:Protein sym-1 n=1 Tax=Momordica charantia TaxID=3673 RepID=A0A6J1DGH9_MOMCH|nr:protein sym-1 [Momordica charantia]XP_022152061.1 protein sym-1 [Momordica charantia]